EEILSFRMQGVEFDNGDMYVDGHKAASDVRDEFVSVTEKLMDELAQCYNVLPQLDINNTIDQDRKSGSAGMPRPISYAVFCLKKNSIGIGIDGVGVVAAVAYEGDVGICRREVSCVCFFLCPRRPP